ncbi:GNAT family N-acetyltransferase [Lentilactobacillus sp. SPB1-3]|uniref:GNAT family N-acetyltransferase n=1 Tax=Lentilactobacillus terminaliae TaxID=3003483 RepID=A0ACD5DFZ3_9LACO|nr:GNAT family N-acetyltransferase [Lentilactobacillus sp. SPB1-3]MCZ0976731.1 GNAT family N-acetyltransferase [Lentilactobacillus sp. SPB1-3]
MVAEFQFNNLLVRPMHDKDQEAVIALRSEKEIMAGLGESSGQYSQAEFLLELANSDEYVITSSAHVIGGVMLNEMAASDGEIDLTGREFSYYLSPLYWGQGIMTNVLKKLIDWILDDGIDHLQAEVFVNNQRSMNLLKRIGFTKDIELFDPISQKNKAIWSFSALNE